MTTAPHRLFHGISLSACALALSSIGLPAAAQPADEVTATGSLRLPRAGKPVGLALGRGEFGLGCDALPACAGSDRALRIAGQAMLSERWGAELAMLDAPSRDFGAGSSRASAVNVSVVGRFPLSESISAYGKVGTTYGQNPTTAMLGSGLTGDSRPGFGLSYGAGMSWQVSPRWSAVVEWDSHDFRFAAGRGEAVHATSLGLQFRY